MSDDIYEVIIGHRRYFAAKVGEIEVSVRVPLHVWESENPILMEPYADMLARQVLAERDRQAKPVFRRVETAN